MHLLYYFAQNVTALLAQQNPIKDVGHTRNTRDYEFKTSIYVLEVA